MIVRPSHERTAPANLINALMLFETWFRWILYLEHFLLLFQLFLLCNFKFFPSFHEFLRLCPLLNIFSCELQ
jgi:hypothetical protein